MPEDIKSLTKKCADLEKRLKFAEAKIKVVADSMTSSKDIRNFFEVLNSKMQKDLDAGIYATEKEQKRRLEMRLKDLDVSRKERDQKLQQVLRQELKAQEQQSQRVKKMVENSIKENVRQAELQQREVVRQLEFNKLQARISTLEGMVANLRK